MTSISEYGVEQAAVAVMRERAMLALLCIWGDDYELAKRVTRRVLDAPPGGSWKDGCPRCVISAAVDESGRDAHELQQAVHIDDWTALANLPLFRPALLGSLLADGLAAVARKQGKASDRTGGEVNP
jgi:hypothetical protein